MNPRYVIEVDEKYASEMCIIMAYQSRASATLNVGMMPPIPFELIREDDS